MQTNFSIIFYLGCTFIAVNVQMSRVCYITHRSPISFHTHLWAYALGLQAALPQPVEPDWLTQTSSLNFHGSLGPPGSRSPLNSFL